MAYEGSYRRVRGPAPEYAPPTRWSAEEDAYLCKRVGLEGASSATVAREMRALFGIARSRNAVIGRFHRMGLAGHSPDRKVSPRKACAPRTPRRIKPRPPRAALSAAEEIRRREARMAVVAAEYARASAPTPAPDMRAVTFAELEAGMCRYIVGDPKDAAHRYCGADGAPWCAFHRALLYQPARAWEHENAAAIARLGATR